MTPQIWYVLTLASSVKRTTVRGRAVLGDVTELSTGVALGSLGLAVPGEVVGSSTAVALIAVRCAICSEFSSTYHGRSTTRTTNEPSTTSSETSTGASESSSASTKASTTRHGDHRGLLNTRSRAITSQVAWKATRVAAVASGASTDAESWAVSLDVTNTLAVVALLGLGGARHGALARLVTGLLALNLSEEVRVCIGSF